MDLQLVRKIEALLHLANIPFHSFTEEISFECIPCLFIIEFKNSHLYLTCTAKAKRGNFLIPILKHCIPQNSFGVVQKICLANDVLILSCELPFEEDAHFWFQILLWQQRLLKKYAEY